MTRLKVTVIVLAALCAAACASFPPGPGAPQPLQRIEAERFYDGVWYEIGRRPMAITDGCVAGATTYSGLDGRRVQVRDTCRQGSPQGPERAIGGSGWIVDPGTNAKLRVRYWAVIVWEYWVLDRADDYSWFISSDPTFKNLFIYTRDPNPPPALVDTLTRRAAALGYDTAVLEFPESAE